MRKDTFSLSKSSHTKLLTYSLMLLSFILYISISYWTKREQFNLLWGQYLVLFACYLWFIKKQFSIKTVLALGVISRILLLFSTPNLSDDFYRFLWDGELLTKGIDPFLKLPSEYIQDGSYIELGLEKYLFDKMNSPNYYTIYPPVLQASFYLSALVSKLGSYAYGIFLMKLLILCTEIGSFYFILKLLKLWKKDLAYLAIYALNPLVIIELVGNIHFEAYMICFLLASLYFLQKQKMLLSSFFMSLAIASKLLPLMFLPFIFCKLNFRDSTLYYIRTFIFCIIWFAVFMDFDSLIHMRESVNLYFQKFEFNASIYYLIREVGYWHKGYNIIGTAGRSLSLIPITFILITAVIKKGNVEVVSFFMLLSLLIYLLSATIIHPWYIIPMIALGLFFDMKFPIYWSLGVILSYIAYQDSSYAENYYFIGLEYLILLIGIWKDRLKINEIFRRSHTIHLIPF
ncbi:hypothetical protein [Sediminitomix flava]|uniref:Mannosyltransferase n=1 Tax=Sediminitomix flava TaxID=379075 RepID=A0A315Z5D3_SEDFL|nr:hypothetical protein [Sediminitomix flava]PWJ38477.1 hypothetical protein BC781_10767 [Sediminitomix flava]